MSARRRLLVGGLAAGWLASAVGLVASGSASGAKPVRSLLTANTDIDGVPCATGYAWRFENGRLQRCTLARAGRVRGAFLPSRATVVFARDGTYTYVFLPSSTVIEGHACRGGGHSYMTRFHANGHLMLCWLENEEMIQGVPCAGASLLGDLFHQNPSGVELAADGRLMGCRLSRDVSADGRTYLKGQRVGRDPSGKLRVVGRGPG